MNVQAKLAILADAAKYDASCASSGSNTRRSGSTLGSTEGMGICHSYTPDGRCVSLLKILFTNYCIYDCKYCVNRVTSDVPRARFTVDEVVRLTIEFYRRNYIEGLFLSSGIIQNADYTMEQLIAVARGLREEHRFGGYIHLKTIPGCDDKLLAEAGLYADRLSVNIELPTAHDLEQLAPEKTRVEIESSMNDIHERIDTVKADRKAGFHAPPFAPAGQSTQMIVGATSTPDVAILATASSLYEEHRLRRVYYSAFSPIPHGDGRLPPDKPPLVREHRLYQADWLLRFYGFEVDELLTPAAPNLDLEIDPKLAWALAHRDLFPVDVNRAPREMLLRIPGVGVKTVDRMIKQRRVRTLRAADLRLLRVAWSRTRHFVCAADHVPRARDLESLVLRERLAADAPRQLRLFDASNTVRNDVA
ncbi:MAG: putative DNA modification/repair radical SAM protein [Planctomycetaceae bacterium]|nr:putative DNA modification/repair radical SAM protein [Planctomycetaceae bacterium]